MLKRRSLAQLEGRRKSLDCDMNAAAYSRQTLSAALVAGQTAVFYWNISSDRLDWDDSLAQLFGRASAGEVTSLQDFLASVHPEDRNAVEEACERCAREGSDFDLEFRIIRPDRQIRWISDRGRALRDEKGRPASVIGACVDVTNRQRHQGQLQDQRDILRAIAAGEPLPGILERLTQSVEQRAERPVIATILLASEDRRHLISAAGQRAPSGWTELINKLEIGPGVGSCGTAAFTGKRVIARDIKSDPRWAPLAGEAAKFGLRACWSSPIFASDGTVLGTFAVYHREPATPTEWEMQLVDVLTGTAAIAIERKRAEEELRQTHSALTESEKVFRAFVTASSDVVYRMNADWTEMRRLEGKAFIADTVDPNRSWLEIYIHPDDRQRVLSAIHEAIREKSIFELEHRVIRVDATLGWTFSRAIPIRDERGEIVEWFGAARDITNTKIAEEKLRESEERFRTMADNIAQFAWMADASGSIFWYNRRWFEYTGTTLDEMKGWGWTNVHHPDHVERVVRHIQQSWQTGEPWEDTFPLRRKDGVYHWFLSRALPIHDARGKVLRWFGTNTDITEQRNTAMELLRTKNELQRLNNNLEQEAERRALRLQETIGELESFSYSIVHDMRAPLRALQGFAQILLEDYSGALDEEGKVCLKNLNQSAERMDGMVRDVLNFSNTMRGRLPLENIDVRALLTGILETYPQFSKDHVGVIIEGEFYDVHANSAALGQCFSNIISNAIKFVAPGMRPQVRISSEKSGNAVRINFEDNGIGIPAEQQEKIFNLFYQLDKNRGGTGVGLAVVRKAVQRMGGQVGVNAAPSGGSRFWIELKGAET